MSDPETHPMPAAGGTYVRLPDGTLMTLDAYELSIAATPDAVPAAEAPSTPKAGKPAKKE